MPYIEPADRASLDPVIDATLRAVASRGVTPGELNYIITRIVTAWIGDANNYLDYNAAVGVVECVKLELYRRRVAPYEDVKMEKNGEVY